MYTLTTSSHKTSDCEYGVMLSSRFNCEMSFNLDLSDTGPDNLCMPTTLDIYDVNNTLVATISYISCLNNKEFSFKIGDGEQLLQVFKPLNSYVYPSDFYK